MLHCVALYGAGTMRGLQQCMALIDQNVFYLQQKGRDLGVGNADSLLSLERPPLFQAYDQTQRRKNSPEVKQLKDLQL